MYKWLNTVLCIFAVTPHAGVRIEIRAAIDHNGHLQSPPTRGCELKFVYDLDFATGAVTPHAGVRIEM